MTIEHIQVTDELARCLQNALPVLRYEFLELAEKYEGTAWANDPAYVAVKKRYEDAKALLELYKERYEDAKAVLELYKERYEDAKAVLELYKEHR